MNTYNTWSDAVSSAFVSLWDTFISGLPTFFGALIILVFGFAIAATVGHLVRRIVATLKVDALVDKTRINSALKETGLHLNVANLAGWVAKWFVVIVTLLAVSDLLGWAQVTEFLQRVALYVPNVLVAIVLLAVGLVVGRYVHELVERGVKASRVPNTAAAMLAVVAEWSIVIFAVLAALTQLGVAPRLIEILFGGLVVALALAFGLAFGLGGRDKAREWLEKLDRELTGKK